MMRGSGLWRKPMPCLLREAKENSRIMEKKKEKKRKKRKGKRNEDANM